MADVRTSYTTDTSRSMRGFASWDPEKHRAMCVSAGKKHAEMGSRGSFAAMPRRAHLTIASKGGRVRGRQMALPRGVCPKRLLPALRALAVSWCSVEARTCLAEHELSGETAGALESRGFATIATVRKGEAQSLHITPLGRRAARGKR